MNASALTIEQSAREVPSERSYFGAILNRLDRAVLVVAAELQLHFVNDFALAIDARRDAIAIERRGLIFLSPSFQGRVLSFMRGGDARKKQCTKSFWAALPRSSGGRDYLLAIHPLEEGNERSGRERFLLEIHEPAGARAISPEALRNLFSLTSAEAIVAAGLFVNCDVNDLSQQLHVSTNTIRTHIRSIYAKCEVRSLPQLLQLIALSPR
jgi:DNA-binding CsgD family transcriptional regulator